jgi:hypothetical protein
MLVFDTSAFVNGRRDHYPVETFPSVWEFVAEAMEDGRIVTPREVLNELKAKDDETCRWAKERPGCFVEPSAEVQSRADAAFTAFIRLIVPGLSPGVLGLSALRAGIGSVTLASVTGASRGTQPKPLLMQPPIRGYGYFEDFPAIPVFAR